MRNVLTALLFIAGSGLGSLQAAAQDWPARPIKTIVPFAAGSALDVVSRVAFEQLATQLGQPIVVENRPGAGGTTGAAFVARADADGYTLLAHSSAHTIAPALYPRLSYHPSRDFVAVAALGMSPFILVVPPDRGFQSVGDLVASAKSKPGAFSFASVGFGSASHLSAERFKFSTGLKAAHVSFRGGSEAVVEVMTGRIDFLFVAAGAALSNVREGTLKALAVNSRERLSSLPDVPTLDQAGVANAEYPLWFGLFVPAGTSPEIVDRLNRELRAALQQPKVKEKLAALGVEPWDLTSAELSALVEMDIASDAALVKAIGLKSN
jgi:tripartite-type tricarboxylate transporter receptor subunit TctC